MKQIFEKILSIYHRHTYLYLGKMAIVISLTVCIFTSHANAQQPCNITEPQTALIKQAFSKYYQTLTNNLSWTLCFRNFAIVSPAKPAPIIAILVMMFCIY